MLNINQKKIKPGKYLHFKGVCYIVIGCAMHTETNEPLVIYYQEFDNDIFYARPLDMFLDTVEHNGKKVQRFYYLN